MIQITVEDLKRFETWIQVATVFEGKIDKEMWIHIHGDFLRYVIFDHNREVYTSVEQVNAVDIYNRISWNSGHGYTSSQYWG